MRRANRLARENARLKGQFKLTKGAKLRESDIRKVTRELLKDYEIIDFDKDELERYIKTPAETAGGIYSVFILLFAVYAVANVGVALYPREHGL